MKYFLILITLSFNSFARDCEKEYKNFRAGLKLTFSINDLMDKFEKNKMSLTVCEDPQKNLFWESERRSITEATFKSSNPDELCTKLEREIREEESCTLPATYLKKLKERDFRRVNFTEACREKLPLLHKLYRICSK